MGQWSTGVSGTDMPGRRECVHAWAYASCNSGWTVWVLNSWPGASKHMHVPEDPLGSHGAPWVAGPGLSPDWWPWWGHNSRSPTEAGFKGGSGSSGPGLAEGLHIGACWRSAWLAVPGAQRCGSRREAGAWAWDGSCWRVGRSLCK